jgi:hypothetical protein
MHKIRDVAALGQAAEIEIYGLYIVKLEARRDNFTEVTTVEVQFLTGKYFPPNAKATVLVSVQLIQGITTHLHPDPQQCHLSICLLTT